jgi:DNA-binding CsgD family transcriptional regulator
LIRDELKQKELEAKELAAQNERMEAELAFHRTELDDFTQSLREKTDVVEKLRDELARHTEGVNQQAWFDQLTQATILTEGQWRSFRQKFENVHTDFFNRLQLQIPTVTEAEKRLLALTKLEMSNGEIAAMLGISPESVTKTRYRLRKKVGDEDLERLVGSL